MSTIDDWRIQRDAFWKRLDFVQQLLTIFIAVFTILGNSLVIIVTWKEKCLHQPNKYFIVLLAVADLLVGLFVAPFVAYQIGVEFEGSESSLSIHLCRFMLWIDTFALTTSIYSLTIISFDRYLKISGPLLYKSRMTTSRSKKIISVIVLISAAFASYSATPQSRSYGIMDTGSGSCNLHTDFEKSATYYLMLTIIAFFLPAVVILIMYAFVFLVAHKRNKRLERGELGQTVINHRQRNALRRDMKVIKMLLVVVGSFIFCWGPWFTWTLMYFYHPNIVEWDNTSLSYWSGLIIFVFIASTLPLFNSLCNPIIYVCLDETYREAFRQFFRRQNGRGQ
ncbi:beta-2 adrenergic receptor-like [Dendronephthya gigantea]|uniref:beta-2 adrenergic receptor-like n=1 Tax=Dendronephthya gigantea TaxID=151771 RepID=UPI00106C6FA9|nr:beta-2 adrenergic receptor-like [Dendronephthya gigantea]